MSLAVTGLLSSAGAQPETFATDDRGFLNTSEEPQFAVAFGRTQRSLVAICVEGSSNYEYRGVRLGDDAQLTVAAKAGPDGTFVAQNEGVTYTFSAKELVITSGERVIRKEPMVAYVEPRLAAEG